MNDYTIDAAKLELAIAEAEAFVQSAKALQRMKTSEAMGKQATVVCRNADSVRGSLHQIVRDKKL